MKEKRSNATVETLSQRQTFDRHPVIHADCSGKRWIAWSSCKNGAERILLTSGEGSNWNNAESVPLGEGQWCDPALCHDKDKLWVAAIGYQNDRWLLTGVCNDRGRWAEPTVLSNGNLNFHPQLILDGESRLWAVWESWHSGYSRIVARYLKDEVWSEPRQVSSEIKGCFRPRCVVDLQGKIWIAWDAFDDGDYQVYLSGGTSLTTSLIIKLTADERCNTSPSLAVDAKNRLWVFYSSHDHDVDWQVRCVVYDPSTGQRLLPNNSEICLSRIDTPDLLKKTDLPLGFSDDTGRIGVLYRKGRMHDWELHLKYYEGKEWSDACVVTKEWNVGCYAPPSAGDGLAWIVWEGTGGTAFCRDGGMVSDTAKEQLADSRIDVRVCRVSTSGLTSQVSEYSLQDVAATSCLQRNHLRERESFFREQQHPAVTCKGKEYRVYWGDPHAQTRLSDGLGEVDQFYFRGKYVTKWDFQALTDHCSNHGKTLTVTDWAFLQTMASCFHDPANGYVTLHAYEWTGDKNNRGRTVEGGHHNIYYPGAGAPIYRAVGDGVDSLKELCRRVKEAGGIAIPHHVAINFAPVPWDECDPEVEPCVEICSDWGAFEYRNGPLAYSLMSEQETFVADALARGLKIGFVGGTDGHGIPNILNMPGCWVRGATGVFVTELSRASVFDALRNRRCFATTGPRIFVDFRLNAELMGGVISFNHSTHHCSKRTIFVNICGVEVITKVEIIKNRSLWHTELPGLREATFEVTDDTSENPTDYYYVRVTQIDGNMAWSSPIWVET